MKKRDRVTEEKTGDFMGKREAESETHRPAQRQGEGEAWADSWARADRCDQRGTTSFADSGSPFGLGAWAGTRRGSRRHTRAAQMPPALLSPEPVGTWGHRQAGGQQLEEVGPWLRQDLALPLTGRVASGQWASPPPREISTDHWAGPAGRGEARAQEP